MRNDLLADIVTASGGTITDRNNRNLLLKDWLEAVQAPAVNYVARLNGTDQYWQLSEGVNYSAGDSITMECSQPGASFDTLISNDTNAFLVRRNTAGNVTFSGCTILIDGTPAANNSTPWPVGYSVFELTLTSNVTVVDFGVRTDIKTAPFEGVIKRFSDSVDRQISLTNKAQGAYQVATTTPLGENLYTQEIIENPDAVGEQWSYLGDGRWQLIGDGNPNALVFLTRANQPNKGYVQFEIESLSGGTLTCSRDFQSASVFDSAGVKTYYYSDIADIVEIQFKRGSGTVQAVIKNIKHYDADGVLVATMVGYNNDVWEQV